MKLSMRQSQILRFVASNPGCSKMDVCRFEWGRRGHRASYDRIRRLIRRGLLRTGKPVVNGCGRVGLFITE